MFRYFQVAKDICSERLKMDRVSDKEHEPGVSILEIDRTTSAPADAENNSPFPKIRKFVNMANSQEAESEIGKLSDTTTFENYTRHQNPAWKEYCDFINYTELGPATPPYMDDYLRPHVRIDPWRESSEKLAHLSQAQVIIAVSSQMDDLERRDVVCHLSMHAYEISTIENFIFDYKIPLENY